MKLKSLLALTLVAHICVTACSIKEYINEPCHALYKVVGVRLYSRGLRDIAIVPDVEFDKSFDASGRGFYENLDTSLVLKGWINKRGAYDKRIQAQWSMVDWRVTHIDVITLSDFDEVHPAGSSLNDIVNVEFFYKNNYISIPADSIEYGNIMLSNYYPHDKESHDHWITISLRDERLPVFPSIEVVVEDFFGNKYISKFE